MPSRSLLLFLLWLPSSSLSLVQAQQTISDSISQSNRFAIQTSLGGGGIFGMGIKYQIGAKIVLHAALHCRPIFIDVRPVDRENMVFGVMPNLGLTFVSQGYLNRKQSRYWRHGMFTRFGRNFALFPDNILAAGWSVESLKSTNSRRSFQLELGPMLVYSPWVNQPKNEAFAVGTKVTVMGLFVKLAWNNYLAKRTE